MTTDITVDPEFQALCPKQTEDEIALLRTSLLKEGCREPIICWKTDGNPILDGMTRYAICTKEDIGFDVRFKEFDSRKDARCWIRENQLGRRNLSDTKRALLRGQLYNEQKDDPTKKPPKTKASEERHRVTTKEVAKEIAAKDGVSMRTVQRDGALAKAVDKLTPLTKTQIAGTRVEDSRKDLKKLAELPVSHQEKVASVIGAGKAKNVAAAMKVAKIPEKPKPGKQKRDPRVWLEAEENLGKAINRVDALQKEFPNKPLHTTLVSQIKQAMATLNTWKESAL
jgi:hypothetical protein